MYKLVYCVAKSSCYVGGRNLPVPRSVSHIAEVAGRVGLQAPPSCYTLIVGWFGGPQTRGADGGRAAALRWQLGNMAVSHWYNLGLIIIS